ncbi:MAG: succinylglutamate desuccinylase, partial [Gammaproteobacteria bacterium]
MQTKIDTLNQNTIQDTIQSLKQHGNFLSLSRTQPALFSTSFQFFIDAHTQVNVLAEGIISFETIANSDKDIVLSCGVHGNE